MRARPPERIHISRYGAKAEGEEYVLLFGCRDPEGEEKTAEPIYLPSPLNFSSFLSDGRDKSGLPATLFCWSKLGNIFCQIGALQSTLLEKGDEVYSDSARPIVAAWQISWIEQQD